ncbi:MAG: hypothetical protein KJ006_04735 [Thermoleophilia bacterium]|nr:hypothetical protein [Thermoleophilia bacterium]
MAILVEPLEGAELDRLITALLNATGAVHQVIDGVIAAGGEGVEVIGRSAERLRAILAVVAEHHGDEELRVITEFLAIATLLIAEEEGFAEAFRPDDDRDDPGDLNADWV